MLKFCRYCHFSPFYCNQISRHLDKSPEFHSINFTTFILCTYFRNNWVHLHRNWCLNQMTHLFHTVKVPFMEFSDNENCLNYQLFTVQQWCFRFLGYKGFFPKTHITIHFYRYLLRKCINKCQTLERSIYPPFPPLLAPLEASRC